LTRRFGASSRIGEQYELFPAIEVDQQDIPWGGVSPRALTKGFKKFSLKAQAVKRMIAVFDPEQCDLFVVSKNVGPRYSGAPLLLPLRGR